MQTTSVNGVTLEYEVLGAGEPVLLISSVIADSLLPLVSEPALADEHRLIRYHKRGCVGSTHAKTSTIEDHAADAAGLLDFLGIRRAHVVGHSSGGDVALQLAIDAPEVVQTLSLLEPVLLSLPSAKDFLEQVKPAFDAYEMGRHEAALAFFMSVVSGMEWEDCRALLERRIPGVVDQTVKDAKTMFGLELPAVMKWTFEREQAAAIQQPVLSVVGIETEPLWIEIAERLQSWLPDVEECWIDGVGHLLHIEQPAPVAAEVADFVARHSIARFTDSRLRRVAPPPRPRVG